MTRRPLSDAQIAEALGMRVPAAPADLRRTISAEVRETPQLRPLPPILGRLADAEDLGRRRAILLLAAATALVALGLAVASGALRQGPPPIPLGPVDQPLDARPYILAGFPVSIRLDGRSGWIGGADAQVAGLHNDLGGQAEAMLSFWTVRFVYESSCPALAPRTLQVDPDGIADALERLPMFELLEARGDTIGGRPARFVELLSPTDPSCANFPVWQSAGVVGVCRCLGNVSQHLRLWVLEVGGRVIIIDATDSPAVAGREGTPPGVRAELDAIVRSIEIGPDR